MWCQTAFSPWGSGKTILPGAKDPARFAEMLSGYVLRRTKEQVGLELPDITEITLSVEMTTMQAAHHKEALRNIILKMAEQDWLIPNAAVAYTRARQVAIDPRILGGDTGSKIPALYGLLEESGSRVIVFSEFVEALKLAHAGYDGWLYYGGMTEQQRLAALVNWRMDPLMRPLYMSRAAGGVALTLTEAHTCVFLDEPWTSTDREQAVARIHRIGQTMPVTVYSLRSKRSVEEHVIKLQSGKRDAIAEVHKHLLTGA
jgi:SNF2 family DNA or RNA helicase